ncbi:MAG: CocE/NonD family hydrolase [Planctomycetota bacterium]|jgi:putative CocE/NonD family hydrolase
MARTILQMNRSRIFVILVAVVLPFSPANGAKTTMVPMRDGVKLQTIISLPGSGTYPTVLTRGYSAGGLSNNAKRFHKSGYAFVSQQCRGRGGSDGTRFFPDDKDGYDTIEWIGKQPWSNGKVAMWGGSYWAATQWRAAVAQPPGLKAIVPGYIDADHWKYGYRSHGAIHLKMTTQSNRAIPGSKHSLDKWKQMLSFVPLVDMDKKFVGREDKLWNDYITHSWHDGYWKAISMRHGNKYAQVSIPVYCMAGWQDYYAGAAFESYLALAKLGRSPDVRVRIGDHGHSGAPDITETIRWLDYHLKGIDTGIKDEPPIKIQVRHGRWRMEDQWPLASTKFTDYYLSTPDGSRLGTLEPQPSRKEEPTRYSYDPDDPVPTLGANGSHYPVPALIIVGPTDQRPNESRQDVLVYTTPRLKKDTEVIGPVEVRLHAASSARDTDFTVKLIDVYPDGRALNVTEGIVRARFRNSIWDAPSLIEPGKTYEYKIELLPIAIVFRKSHRIRIHVSSSSWPLWDRNQNTGNPIGMDAEMVVARQTIYHDAEHLSRIILPIIGDNNSE